MGRRLDRQLDADVRVFRRCAADGDARQPEVGGGPARPLRSGNQPELCAIVCRLVKTLPTTVLLNYFIVAISMRMNVDSAANL